MTAPPTAGTLALGLDFGTESVRAVVLSIVDGEEIGAAAEPYRHGVLDRALPTGERLDRHWALQHPDDWLDGAATAIRTALERAGRAADDVVGIGVAFTACTPLPTTADGVPLCADPALAREPHAWPKLWKHHAAQPDTERLNAIAHARGERFLAYYGGRIGLEWLLPKALQILRESPAVFRAVERFVEGGDWIVRRLTGVETRNACAAGYKGLWNAESGDPSDAFLAAVDPALDGFHRARTPGPIVAPGTRVGVVTADAAARFGLRAGTPVSAATIDAHAGVPGVGVAAPGTMVAIMGTSSCQLAMSERPHFFEGFAGLVRDGILPGYYGYESGQAAVGDVFAWHLRHAVPPAIVEAAARSHDGDVHALLSERAAALPPGAGGVVALDWHQGNRSVLMDGALSGALVGLRLDTDAAQIYRALIEGTAFGARVIVDAYVDAGVPIDRLVVCGGLPRSNPFLVQVYADVLGRPLAVSASDEAVARGAAIFGALAGGAFRTPADAVDRLGAPVARTVDPAPERRQPYDRAYAIYRRLHDHFGRDARDLMHDLDALGG